MTIDGKQLRDASVTSAKLAFTPAEDGDLAWRQPVDVLHLVGNLGEVALEALSPTAGDAYVVSAVDGDGTLNPGSVSGLAVGDLVEWDGAAWVRIVAGSGGFVASGVRAVLATQTALAAPYMDATDDGKIVEFDGTSLTGVATGEALDGNAVLVNGNGGFFENKGYVFSGVVATGTWQAFGAGSVGAGAGLSASGSDLNVGDINRGIQVNADDLEFDASEAVAASGGLKAGANSWQLTVEPADFAGAGLEDDGADNLRIATSAAGNGLTGGGGSALAVDPDSETGGNTQPVTVAANGVGLDVSAIAGTGLEADGSANLRLATQGNGIAGGGGTTLSVDPDSETGGNIEPVSVTANGVGLDIGNVAGTGLAADGAANLQINTSSATVTYTGGTWTHTVDTLQVTGSPDSANDAVNKAYVDSVATGLSWQEPACCVRYVGNDTVANLNTAGGGFGTADQGRGYVVTDAGTLTLGSVAVTAGDIVEWDGTQWVLIHDTATGFPADGVRMVVSAGFGDTLLSPLVDGTDDGKLADFDGTSLTAALTTPSDGWALLIVGEGAFNENNGYVFDGAVPTGTWVQFSGAGQLTAGTGLSKSGNTLNIGDVNRGVQVNADDLELDASEVASTGLEQDATNSWQLRLAAQGNGLAGGAGTTLSVQAANDTVGVTGSGVTAAQPAKGNKGMTASVTTTDNDQATATTVAAAPATDSWVGLAVNGVLEEVGDGTKVGVAAYISGDGGTTARAWNDVVATDTIHWNGSVATYELAATDSLDLIFNDAE